jgi:cytochrome c-type biogenesis protein CcmF
MLPELGHFLLMLALMLSLAQAVCAAAIPRVARIAPSLQCLCVGAAFLSLIHAYVTSDFSVANVAMNSHTEKPLLYKISGAWGNHEGSILLWANVLALFGCGLAMQAVPQEYAALRRTALAIQGGLQAGTLLFLLLTSNPFTRLYPVPFEGKSLNPLLQDVGLALHPPTLYLGYVGFAIVYALAVAALLHGQVTRDLARLLRPWVLIPWSLLTLGVGLGGWWAYRELGWGGWWFWDPVENASLLPWLAGTALLHSLAVLEKRGGLALWVVLLAVLTFSFSLMGTFLVRSGIITSVHSFASDPLRGVFILAWLGIVTGGALIVFAVKAPRIPSPSFAPFTREGAIIANNLILLTAAATVLLGTLYPMLQELAGARPLTIGAPYYNKTVLPLLALLAALAGIAPLLAWNAALRPRLRVMCSAAALAAALAVLLLRPASLWMTLGCALTAWLLTSLWQYWRRLSSPSARQYGMMLAHIGLALFTLALTGSSVLKQEAELRLALHEEKAAAGYRFRLEALHTPHRENYSALQAELRATSERGRVHILRPELRIYDTGGEQTTEAAVHSRLARDLYVALRKPVEGGGAPRFRTQDGVVLSVYVNPLMQLLWFAILCMGAGGILALLPALQRKNIPHG